jgi:pilus assembly protein CpaB
MKAMRAKTILTILFLMSLGVAAWLFLHAMPQNATADVQPAPKQEVLVAAVPLSAGTLLRAEDVAWRPAAGVVEPGTIVRPLAAVHTERDEQARNEVSGAAVNTDLGRGEPLRRTLLVKPGDRDFLQVVLTSGARAIAIPISSAGAGTGLLNPGDRVDVVLTQNFNSEGLARRSVSETIAQNLRILAIDTANAQGGAGRSVMLEVTPEQAEKVGVAAELGKLSLLLRRAGDSAPVAGAADNRARPTWAGDVSPALSTMKPTEKAAPAERPSVGIIRGNKAETKTE